MLFSPRGEMIVVHCGAWLWLATGQLRDEWELDNKSLIRSVRYQCVVVALRQLAGDSGAVRWAEEEVVVVVVVVVRWLESQLLSSQPTSQPTVSPRSSQPPVAKTEKEDFKKRRFNLH